MPVMSKKKRPGRPRDPERPADKDIAYHVRFIDPELYAAVVAWADEDKRSINVAINVLLERALRELGHWPPKKKAEEE